MNAILLYIIVNVFAACHCFDMGPGHKDPPTIRFTTSMAEAYKTIENGGNVDVYSVSVRGVVKKITIEEIFANPKIIEHRQTIFIPPPVCKKTDGTKGKALADPKNIGRWSCQ